MMTLLFLLAAILAPPAHACNNLRIDQLSNIDFNNDPNPVETFRVRRSGNPGCNFFVTVDNGGAPSFSTRRLEHDTDSSTLPVQICADASCANILKHFPEATSNADVLTGSFPNSNSPDEIYLQLRPVLGSVAYQRFGRHEDNFTLRLYEGSVTGSRTFADSDSIRLRYEVTRKIDLSLVSTGLPFDSSSTSKTMNFGTLSTGEQMQFDLVLMYNAGYRVRLSSQRNGALKHSTSASTIPYSLSLGGGAVNLAGSSSSPVLVTQGSGVSPAGGHRLAGNITIGTVPDAAQSGSYADAITITVATTE